VILKHEENPDHRRDDEGEGDKSVLTQEAQIVGPPGLAGDKYDCGDARRRGAQQIGRDDQPPSGCTGRSQKANE
jgi:hypothetical protein